MYSSKVQISLLIKESLKINFNFHPNTNVCTYNTNVRMYIHIHIWMCMTPQNQETSLRQAGQISIVQMELLINALLFVK